MYFHHIPVEGKIGDALDEVAVEEQKIVADIIGRCTEVGFKILYPQKYKKAMRP